MTKRRLLLGPEKSMHRRLHILKYMNWWENQLWIFLMLALRHCDVIMWQNDPLDAPKKSSGLHWIGASIRQWRWCVSPSKRSNVVRRLDTTSTCSINIRNKLICCDSQISNIKIDKIVWMSDVFCFSWKILNNWNTPTPFSQRTTSRHWWRQRLRTA